MADIPSRDWMQASRLMKDRTGPQCMHRWLKSIDPSISRSKWRKEEDLKLAEGVAQYGKVWAKVQRLLPNRTDMQCRERFVNVLAKREDMASRANLDDSITWRRGRWVPVCVYLLSYMCNQGPWLWLFSWLASRKKMPNC
eukprot:m.153545 g.153545  ORF g.153545 m.153545 type:complete len:140 (+) comp16371_c0_seq10:1466-1885(+)